MLTIFNIVRTRRSLFKESSRVPSLSKHVKESGSLYMPTLPSSLPIPGLRDMREQDHKTVMLVISMNKEHPQNIWMQKHLRRTFQHRRGFRYILLLFWIIYFHIGNSMITGQVKIYGQSCNIFNRHEETESNMEITKSQQQLK